MIVDGMDEFIPAEASVAASAITQAFAVIISSMHSSTFYNCSY